MQHVTIGACALSARTYNAEVQGSDARLRNHFVKYILDVLTQPSAGSTTALSMSTTIAFVLYFVEALARRKQQCYYNYRQCNIVTQA